jgi:hypothetical protein
MLLLEILRFLESVLICECPEFERKPSFKVPSSRKTYHRVGPNGISTISMGVVGWVAVQIPVGVLSFL